MSGSGYRKWYIEIVKQGSGGITHRITMPSRSGTVGRGKEHACLGLPDAFALEREQGSHTPSSGAELRQGDWLGGSGSGAS